MTDGGRDTGASWRRGVNSRSPAGATFAPRAAGMDDATSGWPCGDSDADEEYGLGLSGGGYRAMLATTMTRSTTARLPDR